MKTTLQENAEKILALIKKKKFAELAKFLDGREDRLNILHLSKKSIEEAIKLPENSKKAFENHDLVIEIASYLKPAMSFNMPEMQDLQSQIMSSTLEYKNFTSEQLINTTELSELLSLLNEYGFNIDAKIEGETAFSIAVRKNVIKAKIFLDQGAKINEKSNDKTPLEMVMSDYYSLKNPDTPKLVSYLIERGAEASKRDLQNLVKKNTNADLIKAFLPICDDETKATALNKIASLNVQKNQAIEINSTILEINNVIKIVDTLLDVVEFYDEPTWQKTADIALDISQLATSFFGPNNYGLAIAAGSAVNNMLNGEYTKAATDVVTTIGFNMLTTALASSNPYVAMAYLTAFTAYNGYNCINHLHNVCINHLHNVLLLPSMNHATYDQAKLLGDDVSDNIAAGQDL